MLIDTHAHLDGLGGEAELAALLERAKAAGVSRIVAVGGSPDSNTWAVRAATGFPGTVAASLGYDRHQAETLFAPSMPPKSPACSGGKGLPPSRNVDSPRVPCNGGRHSDGAACLSAGLTRDAAHAIAELAREIRELSAAGVKVAGVGETGLDFHYSPETRERQIDLFERQLALARELTMPVVVHSRDAEQETLAALRKHREAWTGPAGRIGVLHCFTGSPGFAAQLIELDFHISFSGIVTFKNAGQLRDVARTVPDDRLLIETDTPYLAPEPHRGKRNEPAYLRHVAETIASVRDRVSEDIARITADNARRLFGF